MAANEPVQAIQIKEEPTSVSQDHEQQQQELNVNSQDGVLQNLPADGKKVTTSDIQLVQNMIERCLQLYLSQKEVVQVLQDQSKIEPGFTHLVWQKLEEQNPDFFRAYYTRLKLKDQIVMFNHILEQQVQMVQKLQRSWMQPGPPGSFPMMAPRPGMAVMPGMPVLQPGMPANGQQQFQPVAMPGMMPMGMDASMVQPQPYLPQVQGQQPAMPDGPNAAAVQPNNHLNPNGSAAQQANGTPQSDDLTQTLDDPSRAADSSGGFSFPMYDMNTSFAGFPTVGSLPTSGPENSATDMSGIGQIPVSPDVSLGNFSTALNPTSGGFNFPVVGADGATGELSFPRNFSFPDLNFDHLNTDGGLADGTLSQLLPGDAAHDLPRNFSLSDIPQLDVDLDKQ